MTGLYDVHCHILPNVDDGAKSLEMAQALLKKELESGVDHIILTPHYRRGMFEPTMDDIHKSFRKLRPIADEIGVQIYLGCEYYADMDMIENLKTGARPTMAGSRYVLCEFSEKTKKDFIRDRGYELTRNGFVPIFAHIERYEAFRKDLDFVEEMINAGCHMQVNAETILGKEGITQKRFAKKLLEYDFIYFIGSDAHNLKSRKPMIGECVELLKKKKGRMYTSRILRDHPRQIIENN